MVVLAVVFVLDWVVSVSGAGFRILVLSISVMAGEEKILGFRAADGEVVFSTGSAARVSSASDLED